MSIQDELKYYLDLGCVDYSNRLGFATVPQNYRLLLNADLSHFFYIKTGDFESIEHWNKWVVYRWIIDDYNNEKRLVNG